MRILIITYYYSPWLNPRAIRWTALSEALAKQRNTVDVLCKAKNGAVYKSNNKAINLYYTGKIDKYNKKPAGNKKKVNKDTVSKLKIYLLKVLKQIHNITWKKVYWPDHACLWYFSAVKLGRKLLHKNKYDLIISVSLPYTSHLVAQKLIELQPKANWIVDIGDPFYFLNSTPTNNHKIYNKLNYISEKNVLYRANQVSVTNMVVSKIYVDLFPECINKIYVIPPVLVTSKKDSKPFFKNNEKINLVYIGTLYRDIRSPAPLLRLLEHLENTELKNKLVLHIVGNVKDCEDHFRKNKNINKKIFLHGLVGYKMVNQILYDNVFLINIGNKTSYQLPSKIVEYISSGNPIINIYSSEFDSSIEFLNEYPLKINVNDKMIETDIKKVLEPFTPESVSKEYLSLN